MQRTEPIPAYAQSPDILVGPAHSAVSWGAVIAGAVIAAALTATLIIGGTGLGFLAVSPWHSEGASGTAFAVGTLVWLFVTQLIAYGIAGYVAGRLRTKWTDARGDEIYFRDTAHGFLVWALSAVVSLVLLGTTAASVVSGASQAGASLAGSGAGAISAVAGQAAGGGERSAMDYLTDTMLRPADPAQAVGQGDVRPEVNRILAKSVAQGKLSPEDQSYLVKLISARAGIPEVEAQRRLSQVTAQAVESAQDLKKNAKEAADAARKAAAAFSLWAFASLLFGAFIASFAATIGGRARDL